MMTGKPTSICTFIKVIIYVFIKTYKVYINYSLYSICLRSFEQDLTDGPLMVSFPPNFQHTYFLFVRRVFSLPPATKSTTRFHIIASNTRGRPFQLGNPSTSRGPFNPGSIFIAIYEENDPGLNGPLQNAGFRGVRSILGHFLRK